MMKRRSIVIAGHKTSLRLENAFWDELRAIARARQTSMPNLLLQIKEVGANPNNLASSIRLYVLAYNKAWRPERPSELLPNLIARKREEREETEAIQHPEG